MVLIPVADVTLGTGKDEEGQGCCQVSKGNHQVETKCLILIQSFVNRKKEKNYDKVVEVADVFTPIWLIRGTNLV